MTNIVPKNHCSSCEVDSTSFDQHEPLSSSELSLSDSVYFHHNIDLLTNSSTSSSCKSNRPNSPRESINSKSQLETQKNSSSQNSTDKSPQIKLSTMAKSQNVWLREFAPPVRKIEARDKSLWSNLLPREWKSWDRYSKCPLQNQNQWTNNQIKSNFSLHTPLIIPPYSLPHRNRLF